MSINNKIKNNRFVRGLHFLWSSTFGCSRLKFGYLANNTRFTPPHQGTKSQECLYIF